MICANILYEVFKEYITFVPTSFPIIREYKCFGQNILDYMFLIKKNCAGTTKDTCQINVYKN